MRTDGVGVGQTLALAELGPGNCWPPDPQPRGTVGQNGVAVARFGVATNSAWTDESGEKREEVEFHNVVAFGHRQAETAGEYLRKGQLVLVEGRLRASSWTTEGGKAAALTLLPLGSSSGRSGRRCHATPTTCPRRTPPPPTLPMIPMMIFVLP